MKQLEATSNRPCAAEANSSTVALTRGLIGSLEKPALALSYII